MINYNEHLIRNTASIKSALIKLDSLAKDAILFITDDLGKLEGSLTDGDIRRAILNGAEFDDKIYRFVNKKPYYFVL